MSADDILELANEELSLRLVPLVRESRGDYWVTSETMAIEQGQAAYRVPDRAQGSALRDLTVITPSGHEWGVPQMALEEAGAYQVGGAGLGVGVTRFYMQGTDVVLVPTPQETGFQLRMRYHRAHSELVLTADTGHCTWGGGATLTLTDYPAAWDAFTADIYQLSPPFGMAAADAVVTDVTAGAATVTGLADLGLTVGRLYGIAYAHQTSTVDLPRECWPLLVSALTARVCDVIGDREQEQVAYALYERESVNVMRLLTPRVEGRPQRVIQRGSLLRSRARGW